jgi:hypothetical protein
MPSKLQVFGIIFSAGLLVTVFELIRSRRLEERYSLLWLTTGAALLYLSIKTDALNFVARVTGIVMASNAFFLFSILFLFLLVLSLTVIVSSLSRKNRRLPQEVALIIQKVERAEPGTVDNLNPERNG